MAIMWSGSLIPWIDANGDPRSGAKAYFFDAGTTTPQIVYTTAALDIPHDHPVVADSSGSFPAVFLTEESTYRLRVETSAGVTLHDVDNISVPTATPADPPEGETAAEFLYQTGDIKMAWRTTAPNGYVRLNGRTIGAAASGATERANIDAEALFLFLWTQDANLAVSGGRGGTNTGDWAANKTIALPDWRGRSPAGLDSMGNAASNRITDAQIGADSDTLGTAGGTSAQTLTVANLPASPPTGTVNITDPGHKHLLAASVSTTGSLTAANQLANNSNPGNDAAYDLSGTATAATLGLSASGTTGVTAAFVGANLGSGTAHNNLQPTVLVPFFIKL